jgi:6-phosphogluconate dehydrogenase (NAD)
MKFTNECKTLLEKILKENEVDCVEIVLTEGENGDIDINLGIVDSKECERVVEIDGVKVAIDEDTHAALIDAIFSADGDELTIGFEEHEGCCCGGHGHHEGECCCGEEGEEGCCCGEGHGHHHHGEGCCGNHHDHEEEHCCCGGHHHEE